MLETLAQQSEVADFYARKEEMANPVQVEGFRHSVFTLRVNPAPTSISQGHGQK